MKRSTKEKSPWVNTKAKTGTKKKKSGEFADESRRFSRTVTRARGLISFHRSAKRNLAMNIVVFHLKV